MHLLLVHASRCSNESPLNGRLECNQGCLFRHELLLQACLLLFELCHTILECSLRMGLVIVRLRFLFLRVLNDELDHPDGPRASFTLSFVAVVLPCFWW